MVYSRISLGSTATVAGGVVNPAADGSDPSKNGFLLQASDPVAMNSANVIGAGAPTLIAIPVTTAVTVSTLWYGMTTAGATLTAAQNWVGIYGNRSVNTINLLGLSPDQSTNFAAGNVPHSAALTVQGGQSLTLPAGSIVYAAFLFNGTTSPTLNRIGSQSVMSNVNLVAPALRSFVVGSGATTLPLTLDLTTQTIVSPFWAALS